MDATRRPIIVGFAVAAAIIGGAYAAKRLVEGGAATPPSAQILNLLNQRRARYHLVPLKRDLVLASLARGHNRDERSKGFFAHDDPQGQTFFERLAYLHRSLIGEVIAYGSGGFGTPKGLVSLWMASPEHRRIILTPGMRRIGISVITGPFLGQSGISLATADLSS